MDFVPRWHRYGERGVLFDFDDAKEVQRNAARVRAAGFAVECVAGASTVYVEGRDRAIEKLVADALVAFAEPAGNEDVKEVRLHTVLCRYDGEDLGSVADLAGISEAEVVERHCAPTYVVAFVGFSRGFPYLSGLDPLLVVPRLATPRISVPAGSVGTGAGYTGIYPMQSPGGWRLLGRTDAVVFDPTDDPPNRFEIGDHVRFVAIS